MFEIHPKGTKAVLKGPLTSELNELLKSRFVWTTPLDLTIEKFFYADRVMYVGIMHQLQRMLVNLGYECCIVWPKLPRRAFDWKFTGKYREHQEEAVQALLEGKIGIFTSPPRFGKTVVMASVVCEVGQKASIIVANQEPLNQAYETLKKFTNIKSVGRVGDNEYEIGDVTVFTIQSILARQDDHKIREHLESSLCVLVDEAHKAAADSFIYLFDNLLGNPYYFIGVSATPYRTDDRDEYLKALLGQPIFERSIGDLIETKNICPITFYVEQVPTKVFGYIGEDGPIAKHPAHIKNQYQKVYREYIVDNPARHKIIANFTKGALKEGLTVGIVVDRIEHAENLQPYIDNSVVLHAKTKNRKEILDKLRHREVQCVITTIFQEAVDIPSLDCIVLAAGGKSSLRLKQRLRNLTKFDGLLRTGPYKKERAYVLYLKDRADFLRTHSNESIKTIKKIVKEHKLNEYFEYKGI